MNLGRDCTCRGGGGLSNKGKENGNYYITYGLGFHGLGFRVLGTVPVRLGVRLYRRPSLRVVQLWGWLVLKTREQGLVGFRV